MVSDPPGVVIFSSGGGGRTESIVLRRVLCVVQSTAKIVFSEIVLRFYVALII